MIQARIPWKRIPFMIRLMIRPPVGPVSLNEVADLNGLDLQKLAAPRRLKSREVANHEEQVRKPEGEPDRCDNIN